METLNANNKQRLCRKCGIKIPVSSNIDGKRKSLQNRKFCLECSPYKNKNPTKKRKYTQERGRQQILSLYKRGLERKQTLIEISGGKCISCGYCKCTKSLSFHHRNPAEKCFGLSLNELWSKTWETILKEFNKCDLYCLNCHMELEGINSQIIKDVNDKYGTNFI